MQSEERLYRLVWGRKKCQDLGGGQDGWETVSFSPASHAFIGKGERVAEMVDAQAEGFSLG